MAMSVGSDEGDETSISTINTTPLVDIMLVLLIIFLITVPVIKKMAAVEIPKAVNIPTQTKPENITISVDTGGKVYWNATPMTDKQMFFSRIVAEARKVPQPEFHIRGDKSARWEAVGRVIYNLQRGGIVKVGFITEPDRGSIRVTR
ncbi:MAG TPA: biopolymer transporter ExbD [Steroidobacteraceae bacterium]|nr:biopolymer transporter ExbD [Steroidobacteraceae bacterium]